MKNKYFFIFLYVFFFSFSSVSGNEITFESEKIEIIDNGNKIISNKGVANSIDHGLTIKADNFDYNKTDSILIAKKKCSSFLGWKKYCH